MGSRGVGHKYGASSLGTNTNSSTPEGELTMTPEQAAEAQRLRDEVNTTLIESMESSVHASKPAFLAAKPTPEAPRKPGGEDSKTGTATQTAQEKPKPEAEKSSDLNNKTTDELMEFLLAGTVRLRDLSDEKRTAVRAELNKKKASDLMKFLRAGTVPLRDLSDEKGPPFEQS